MSTVLLAAGGNPDLRDLRLESRNRTGYPGILRLGPRNERIYLMEMKTRSGNSRLGIGFAVSFVSSLLPGYFHRNLLLGVAE